MREKSKIFDKNIFFLSLILIVFVITGFFIYRQTRSSEFTVKTWKNDFITVSINISDNGKLLFSELIIICPSTNKAAIFNVPGNYGLVIESMSKLDRLDILFDHKTPEKMLKKIETITTLPVDFYLNITTENLVKTVDILSGLELFTANPVEIINEKEIILLPSGSNVLDGEKVIVFISADSKNENDADLIGRWHKFVQAFIKKTGENNRYFENKKIFNKFYSFFETNIDKESFKDFFNILKKVDSQRIVLQRIHGDRKTVDNQILLFPYYNGNLLKETIKQTLATIKNEESINNEEINIAIEILNGTNIPGMASRTAHFFTNLGFDVKPVRNAEKNNYEKTIIIANASDPSSAQKVANIIRCDNIVLESDSYHVLNSDNNDRFNKVDVILILGNNFDGRYCK